MLELIKQLKVDEGKRLKLYKCTGGKNTIGFGRNLDDIGISDDEAELMLQNDVKRAWEQSESFEWFKMLNYPRKCAIVNMVFNIGFNGVSKFKNMITSIEQGDFDSAYAHGLDSRWANQVGDRAVRVMTQLKTGEFA